MTDMINLIADFSKMLGDPIKLKIIKTLKEKSHSSKEIQEILDLSQSYTSTQLKKLKDQDIITSKKEGKNKIYSLKNFEVLDIISNIHKYLVKREKEKLSRITKLEDTGF